MELRNTKPPSNEKFGLFFSAIFLAIGVYFLFQSSPLMSCIQLGLAVSTITITALKPNYLTPLNKSWMSIGLFMGKIMSPIIMGIIFFFIFTPIAWAMRICKRDELRLRTTQRTTYWKNRSPNEPETFSFKNQF